tara:strand:- start:74 stop:577 length:504 start_codon:yes stop_codon:yes gene_type:complete
MAANYAYTMEEVTAKYPLFAADRFKYEKLVIIESLQWRIKNPSSPKFSLRPDLILTYFPYLDKEAVRTVQQAFRKRFYSNKDDSDYSKFWNEPALSEIFSDLEKTNNALTSILIEGENTDGSLTARMGVGLADIDNNISIDYNGLAFKGKLKSEAHFYAIIDAVRNF